MGIQTKVIGETKPNNSDGWGMNGSPSFQKPFQPRKKKVLFRPWHTSNQSILVFGGMYANFRYPSQHSRTTNKGGGDDKNRWSGWGSLRFVPPAPLLFGEAITGAPQEHEERSLPRLCVHRACFRLHWRRQCRHRHRVKRRRPPLPRTRGTPSLNISPDAVYLAPTKTTVGGDNPIVTTPVTTQFRQPARVPLCTSLKKADLTPLEPQNPSLY